MTTHTGTRYHYQNAKLGASLGLDCLRCHILQQGDALCIAESMYYSGSKLFAKAISR